MSTGARRLCSVASRACSRQVRFKSNPKNFSRSFTTGASPLRAPAQSRHFQNRHHLHTKKAGIGYWSLTLALIVVSAGSYIGLRITQGDQSDDAPPSAVPPELDSAELGLDDMAAQTPSGRPGNLTPEQEATLREFWVAVLKVFGVPSLHLDQELDDPELNAAGGEKDGVGDTVADERHKTNTTGPEKRKKSRMGIFGRKGRKDDDGESAGPSEIPTPATPTSASLSTSTEVDDKYGQTKEFKLALASLTPEDLRQAFWGMVKHDHPDGLLLRFLRARKWDVEKALVMLVSTMHWRAREMHVDDDIMKNGDGAALEASSSSDPAVKREGQDFLTQLRMGKSYLHGVDKEGRPMCFVHVRLHRQGEQTEKSLEQVTVYIIETARLLLRPPVDTATIVFDMTGFSMANMDYTPVKFMIKCFEANYPESLGAVLVYKSPWIFHGIWNIIKGWLDPVVASKVHFAKTMEELEHFVPRNHIPKPLGGTEDWEYHYTEPRKDENHTMADSATLQTLTDARLEIVKRFEQATLYWINIRPSSDKAAAAETTKQRSKLADELRENYWKVDPFVRARSLYDRQGVLGEGGVFEPYPGSRAGVNGTSSSTAKAVPETSADDVD